jgi:hypothetical protein
MRTGETFKDFVTGVFHVTLIKHVAGTVSDKTVMQ